MSEIPTAWREKIAPKHPRFAAPHIWTASSLLAPFPASLTIYFLTADAQLRQMIPLAMLITPLGNPHVLSEFPRRQSGPVLRGRKSAQLLVWAAQESIANNSIPIAFPVSQHCI